MAAAAGFDGDRPVIVAVKKPVPEEILQDSALAHVAAAYFAVGKRLEHKTRCSATRGFILSALRNGASLNQNQIATQLGLDRTVVHRAIKSMRHEGLVSEKKAKSGRAILVQLTEKGNRYREGLVKARKAADAELRRRLSPGDLAALLRLLKQVAELDF
jgi:DNA-binding MarR family transcriptional regulator